MLSDNLYGFSLVQSKKLPEIEATLYRMVHDKTGAELIWLDRDDENKTFGIAFKTLPFDDSGVFHILEHSVLCGSEKYPVKEPFVELMKSSLNTFLNALTFPDKTFYPISSKNDKDFVNLMRVYLDAVFRPLIYSRPEIFSQEGWHLEKDEDGNYSYKGVVLNEMKGAFASPDELVANSLNACLFPNSPYRFVSGGDPTKIPTLSYETFIETHRKFYSPSNSYIFLDGDIDIENTLKIIDSEYLYHFGKTERIAVPPMQKPVKSTYEGIYEVSSDSELEGKTRLTIGMAVGRIDDKLKLRALNILSSYLSGTNQSPLSRAILDEGLAENITMNVNDSVLQPWFAIDIQNIKEENIEKIQNTIESTLDKLLKDGLDYSELDAIMTNSEFKLRERDYGSYPKGLIFAFDVLDYWLNGADPSGKLEVGDMFTELRSKMKNGYFEELIRDEILHNPHACRLIFRPSKTLGEERRAAEQKEIDSRIKKMSEKGILAVDENQERLLSWQESADSEESLATLPKLSVEDIPAEPEKTPTEVIEYGGRKILLHKINTGGIVYVRLYFDVSGLSEEELSVLSFTTNLLGKSATSKHSADEIINRKRLLCGTFYNYFNFFTSAKDRNVIKPFLCTYFSALEDKLFDALDFVLEVMTNSVFKEKDINDYLRQLKSAYFEQIIMYGNAVAVQRLSAQSSAVGVYNDLTDGIAFYEWLRMQSENCDLTSLGENMSKILSSVISSNGVTISIAGTDEYKSFAKKTLESLPNTPSLPKNEIKPWGKRNEGIIVPSDTCFAVMGGYTENTNSGKLLVASQIVSLSYLWNTVRVQGGAYGTGLISRDGGFTACYSYRDPNGENSIESYKGVPDFLRAFAQSTDNLDDFIIGTISNSSSLMTPRSNAQTGDRFYFSDRTWQSRCDTRRDLLSTSQSDLMLIADSLEKSICGGSICVIGGKKQIDGIENLDNVFELKN